MNDDPEAVCPNDKHGIHFADNQGLCHGCGMPMNKDSWELYGGPTTDAQWADKMDYWRLRVGMVR